MKIAAFIISALIVQTAIAQKKDTCYAGVYLNYDDFKNNRLSFKVNADRKENSFGFGPLAHIIKIVTPDTMVKFSMGSIYGYYDCGNVYRYSPDVELYSPEDYYKIEEMGNEENKLTIYTSVFKGGTEYFFSTGLNMPIHRLSMSHIENDFKGLFPRFVEAVKKMKSEHEGDIAAKDSKGNLLINKLYQQYVTY